MNFKMFKNVALNKNKIDRRLCIAPMMNWTDRHCRFFHRNFSPNALLFTEMIPVDAILNSNAVRFCYQNYDISPVAIQIGGSDPEKLFKSVKIIEPFKYDEINLNLGCPSSRVQSGRFGACLMKEPDLVKECIFAIKQSTNLPFSVKCRIGVDDMDVEKDLDSFIEKISVTGIKIIYIHSRKAILNGLSPKQNREIPKLNYERAARLAKNFSDIDFILNGGINSLNVLEEINEKFYKNFVGIMIGREAYKSPKFIAEISNKIFGDDIIEDEVILKNMIKYAEIEKSNGERYSNILRHLIGMFRGFYGAKRLRCMLVNEIDNNSKDYNALKKVAKEYLKLKRGIK